METQARRFFLLGVAGRYFGVELRQRLTTDIFWNLPSTAGCRSAERL